jgi:hypothetical protein
MKNTINTSKIEKAINHLIQVVDETLENSEPRAYDEVVNILVEKMGDEIYKSDAGSLMSIIHEISEPGYEKKRLCLGSALSHADDKALNLIGHLTDTAFSLHRHINSGEPNPEVIRMRSNELKHRAEKVHEQYVGEIQERVQYYREDIDKLLYSKSESN